MTATDSAQSIVMIKEEPTDFHFDTSTFTKPSTGQSLPQYAPWQTLNSSIDPMDLSMSSAAHQQAFGSAQNLNNFVTDEDLMGSLDVNANNGVGFHATRNVNQHYPHGAGPNGTFMIPVQQQGSQCSQQRHPSYGQISHTPDGAPIRSPFVNSFDYNQWSNHVPQQVARSLSGQGVNPSERPGSSMSHSPMTPMTPGMGNLQLATPETGSYPGRAIHGSANTHRHSSSATRWENSLGSSHLETPLSSPGGPMHPQISEVLRNGGPTSPGSTSVPTGHGRSASTAEMKKAKRRASHNEVERRRRNHINDQITALSRLVPSHRLEDDAIRRSLNTNASLPSSIVGNGPSSPQATSLLAGGVGRRAAGNAAQGIPVDEKDKGPAKGDVLNGAVGWTQDLLWMMNMMIQREEDYQQTIRNLGGSVNVHVTDDELRMRTELQKAFDQHTVKGSAYTRHHGSGLWVPGHTDQAGSPVNGRGQHDAVTAQGMTVSGMTQGDDDMSQSYWTYGNDMGRDSIEFKEEEELDFDCFHGPNDPQ